MWRVVIDTNVLVSALRSHSGASFRLIQKLGAGYYLPLVSTPLCFECEDVLHRLKLLPGLAAQEIDDFLDYFLSESVECQVHFLWRPYLPDQKDDMILELALAGGANGIITHNARDFRGADAFGIQVMTPTAFLSMFDTL